MKNSKKTAVKLIAAGIIGGAVSLGGNIAYDHFTGDTPIKTNQTSTTKVSDVSYKVSSSTTKAIAKVSDAVVSVINYQKASSSNSLDDLFGDSSSTNKDNAKEQPAGEGSGVIYKKDSDYAYIVTNNHVVDGASSLEIMLSNGNKVKGTLVGKDAYSDLAVIKIPSKEVTKVAEFGDSSKLTVGEPAIAIGSPLGSEYANSATEGIISSLSRKVIMQNESNETVNVNAIQTDAAINPGNSGGALINVEGQVIGINSSKISATGSSSRDVSVEGMGFAIPSNDVVEIISDLSIYHIPFMPKYIEGVLNRCGEPFTVVNPNSIFDDNPDAPPPDKSLFMIFKRDDDQLSLHISDILLFTKIEDTELKLIPDATEESFFLGTVGYDGEEIPVLNPNAFEVLIRKDCGNS